MEQDNTETDKLDFLEINQKNMDLLGFWSESYKSTIILSVESAYKNSVIRDWFISNIVIDGDKVLIKWQRRTFPLTDEQIKEKYGRSE